MLAEKMFLCMFKFCARKWDAKVPSVLFDKLFAQSLRNKNLKNYITCIGRRPSAVTFFTFCLNSELRLNNGHCKVAHAI